MITDHGAQLSADGAQLDCKASKPLIVDHLCGVRCFLTKLAL